MALLNTENMAVQMQGFGALPVMRQLGLMIGLAASVAIGVAIVLWAQEPSYRVLYGNLSEKDSALVTAELAKSAIPYKVSENNGNIMVPASDLHNARLKLAAAGLPGSSSSGYEILEKEQTFGTSQFMENARYQRALEGELAQTISAMSNVQSARVHLAIPKQSAFVRNRKKPSASVLVHLHPGQSVQDGQVAAIAHLVSSSIPNLDIADVTVVDQRGRLLSSPQADQDVQMSESQFGYRRKLEEHYIKRIEDILSPILGYGAVKAQVVADIDFTYREETAESYSPENTAVRSEQVSEEETRGAAAAAGGVPGALVNQPPVAAVDATAEQGDTLNSSRQSTRNFELDRTISRTRLASGTVQRISAAVVLDDRQALDEEGAVVRKALTEDEIARFTALVKEAIGFNEQRGDKVTIINAAFSVPEEVAEVDGPPIWQQGWFAGALKQLAAGIGILVLVFGVLKPILKDLANKGATLRVAVAAGEGAEGDAGEAAAGRAIPAIAGRDAAPMLAHGQTSYDTHLAQAKAMVGQDPKVVAQVVRNWVASDGR